MSVLPEPHSVEWPDAVDPGARWEVRGVGSDGYGWDDLRRYVTGWGATEEDAMADFRSKWDWLEDRAARCGSYGPLDGQDWADRSRDVARVGSREGTWV